ncbi:class I SAM-dependent methyltransferase [Bradyrhizobium sp. NAS80.1]|uniref:class I SAM-dependent methyltransferase n=1 Tax=Bradyrhizobium sp. NAS80.1 TaxID=1680159 RepID=UPI000A01B146|nr:class I SAM-dependent methyltransferase [Bradyrhizobium sp. NAS80.1]
MASHPEGCVLHLGCGLDTRVFRIDPSPSVRWFDVDYPEVIALRQRLYPARFGCELVSSSVVDPAWLERVPADRPVLVVAEGLVMYLRKDEVQRLFSAIVERFPAGEMAFDAFSRLGVWFVQRQPSVQATGATLHWSIDDPHDVERLVPRLKFVAEVPAYDRSYLDRFSFPGRMSIKAMLAIPTLRRLGRFLRYRFQESTRGPGRCGMQKLNLEQPQE